MTATYDRAALEGELHTDEGYRLKAYKDTAVPPKWTIGTGRNLDGAGTAPLDRTKEDIIFHGISPQEAKVLLTYDINRTEGDLDRHWPWWRTLDPVRQRVLMNMCFNMGPATLAKFVNMLHCVQTGQYIDASLHMLRSAWAGEVGARASRLARMMRTGR